MSKVKEKDILKALNELEELALAKGDALENADTEGGFSTEGKPLSGKAPSGRGETAKSVKKDVSKSESASDMDDASSGKKTKKAMPPPGDDESSDDAGSDDDSDDASPADDDDDSDDMSKSLREAADEDETMRKAVEVSEFLESLVDQTSGALQRMEKSITKKLSGSIEKSFAEQGSFNVRLARGVIALGSLVKSQAEQIDQLTELVKSFANAPTTPRPRAMLTKSDVQQSPIGDAHDNNSKALNPEAVVDWMITKGVDPLLVTRFETSRYNVSSLPPDIQKALVHDLVK